ncbi:hypothetical protein KCU65_g5706, partial [Aureobasidium melanogenum]
MSDTHAINQEEPEDECLKMQSQTVAEFYPEHYAATGGRASPRLPHEMDEEALLATAIARFRPLNQPLPPGFDIDSLPVYRAPVSHHEIEDADVETTEHATRLLSDAGPSSPAAEDQPVPPTQTAVAAISPRADQPTPQRLSCEWHGCGRNFEGADAPARLVSHINHDHIGLPVPRVRFNTPRCRWGNCNYHHQTRRFMVAHCMTHVPEYKIFFCSVCGRGFQQKAHVVRHEGTHVGEE